MMRKLAWEANESPMSDRLTLVVFKDHLSSRTLTVRLAWLRAFSFALLSVIGLAVLAAALFFNAYRKTVASGGVASAIRVEELEKELADTKASYESVKQQALNSIAGGGAALAGASHSFSLLPAEAMLEPVPGRETLPFRLEPIKAQWKGSTLQIRTAIEYAREDGGNQQGHFVILARGPQTVTAYPDGVFALQNSPSLIKPEGGEFFSVSRYREVKAEFGPFSRRDDVQSIEILIFDARKRLLFHDQIALQSTPAKTIPAPPPSPSAPPPAPKKVERPAAAITTPPTPAAEPTAAPDSPEAAPPTPVPGESP